MRRILPLLLLASGLACRDATPARLTVGLDTLLINGPAPIALPVQAIGHDGQPITRFALDITASSDSAVLVSDGAARCRRAGDATLEFSAGDKRASMLVQCRPIAGFNMAYYDELRVGGPPIPMPLLPVDSLGQRVTEWRAGSRVLDTTVARVRDGRIYPQTFGRTWIVVDFGGLTEVVSATVIELVAEDTVSLARGEYRTWPLPSGRFQITLTSPDSSAWSVPPMLAADGANCALYRSPELTMHCVVERAATVMVRVPERSREAETNVAVRIVRRPEWHAPPRRLRVSQR